MFHIRRLYKTTPGSARKVATLVHKEAQIFKDAGQRGDFIVYFNGGTTPSEVDTVVLEWTDEALMSISREGNDIPPAANDVAKQLSELIVSSSIEFNELLIPAKMIDWIP